MGYLSSTGKVTSYQGNIITMHETGATVQQLSSGKTATWQVCWKNKTYGLGDRWRQKLQSAVSNATGQVALTIRDAPYVWNEGQLTPLLPNGQKGSVSGLNASGQAVGTVNGRAYLWSKLSREALFLTRSRATAINERKDVIGEVWEPEGYAYLWQRGKLHQLSKPVYSGELTRIKPVAVNNRTVVLGTVGLIPPTDEKHGSRIPWDTPIIWNAGRTEFLASIVENPENWGLENAVAINDKGQILVTGHHPGQAYPSHLLLLTPLENRP